MPAWHSRLTKREVVDSIIIRAPGPRGSLCHDTLIQVMTELADTRPDSLTIKDDPSRKKKSSAERHQASQTIGPLSLKRGKHKQGVLEAKMLERETKQRRESFAAEHQRLLRHFSALEKDRIVKKLEGPGASSSPI